MRDVIFQRIAPHKKAAAPVLYDTVLRLSSAALAGRPQGRPSVFFA
jgi:hypothetical protein